MSIQMVKDIYPGRADSSPRGLTDIGGVLYFQTGFSSGDSELWRSDGTAAGTYLVKDINPTGDASPYGFTDLGGRFLFSADAGYPYGSELWSSDGSEEGTTLVKDINPGSQSSNPIHLTSIGELVLFAADDGDDADHGRELWRSDGTELGTQLVKDIRPGYEGSDPMNFISVGNQLFFTADDGQHGHVLWRSDGTLLGTRMLTDQRFVEEEAPRLFEKVGNTLFFSSQGRHLWKSDGTQSGTTQLSADFGPDASFWTTELQSVGEVLFIAAGRQLWRSDGTSAGTELIKGFNSDAQRLASMGRFLVFNGWDQKHGRELWRSDGTPAGTKLVRDIQPGPARSDARGFMKLGRRIFFSANDGRRGRELWVSDGTAAGTRLAKDIRPHEFFWDPDGVRRYLLGSNPDNLTNVDGTLFFVANNGMEGRELWRVRLR